jgi:lipid-A-disaccharide synthase
LGILSKPVVFSPISGGCDLLVVAGEASGDEHAARVVRDLLEQKSGMKISALGGKELKSAGAELVFPLSQHAVVGLWEVLKNYRMFKVIFEATIQWIKENQPKCVLLVDYPGFNLRLAKALKQRGISSKGGGEIKILQYISPQLWAWKANRRFEMAKTLDALGTIFPFEQECYPDVSLPVSFVGHPFSHPSYQSPVVFGESGDLLLLPGSRSQPVSRILPSFLDAFEILLEEGRELNGILPVSDSSIRRLVENLLASRTKLGGRIKVVGKNSKFQARAALMSSGTMSLSCSWAGVPGVIGYRAHPLTYLIGRFLVKVPHLGMANLLLPQDLPNPEFLQSQASGIVLAREIGKILDDPKSGEHAGKIAKKLHKLLAHPQELSLIDWLVQEGRLG